MGGDKRQGGSTITQQVAKNLLVGDSLTFERKIREVIVANRIEKTLTKQEILEIYLNSIYLGRSSWGIDLAARAYFGKPVKDLTLAEGAFIAGLTKGPAYYNPDRYRERAPGAPRLCADPDEGRRLDHGGAGERCGGRAAELHGLHAGSAATPDSIWSTRSAARPGPWPA